MADDALLDTHAFIWFRVAPEAQYQFLELPLTSVHALPAGNLDSARKDPFDRALVAQALSAQLPIIPGDEVSGRMPGVEVLWGRFTGVATHRTPDRTLGAELRKRTLPDRRRPDPRAGTHARMYYIGS